MRATATAKRAALHCCFVRDSPTAAKRSWRTFARANDPRRTSSAERSEQPASQPIQPIVITCEMLHHNGRTRNLP